MTSYDLWPRLELTHFLTLWKAEPIKPLLSSRSGLGTAAINTITSKRHVDIPPNKHARPISINVVLASFKIHYAFEAVWCRQSKGDSAPVFQPNTFAVLRRVHRAWVENKLSDLLGLLLIWGIIFIQGVSGVGDTAQTMSGVWWEIWVFDCVFQFSYRWRSHRRTYTCTAWR